LSLFLLKWSSLVLFFKNETGGNYLLKWSSLVLFFKNDTRGIFSQTTLLMKEQ